MLVWYRQIYRLTRPNIFHLWSTLIRVTVYSTDEYRRRFDSGDWIQWSPTNTADQLIRIVLDRLIRPTNTARRLFELQGLVTRLRIPPYANIRFVLQTYSQTNTADAYSSCLTFIRRRIPQKLFLVAEQLIRRYEYRRFSIISICYYLLCRRLNTARQLRGELPRRLFAECLAEAFSNCWTLRFARRIPPTLRSICWIRSSSSSGLLYWRP